MSDLPAGRELDVLVAARVMSLAIPAPSSIREWRPVQYSTAWEGMRLVVERMRELGWWVDLTLRDEWQCKFHGYPRPREILGSSDTLPHAVCLAALAAVEAEGKRC